MQEPLNILFIEDQPNTINLISKALERDGFRVAAHQVTNAHQLSSALQNQTWSVILANFHLMEIDIHDILKTVQNLMPTIPLIVISDPVGEETLVELLRGGARDFISVQNLSRLGPVILRELAEKLAQPETVKMDEATQNFRKLAENIRDLALIFTNAEGKITSWNPAARRIFGYTEAEAVGKFAGTLYLDEDQSQDLFHREMGRAQTELNVEEERWQKRKNGSRFWGVGSLTAVLNDDGSLGGFAKVLRDSTNKKMALEQVEEARKRAEAANKSKTQFLANMSHEIRTPLGIMLGFAELMMDPTHSEAERAGFADTILKNGQQLSRIINDVLDVSKVEFNKLETEKIDFTLSEFLADVLAMLRMQAEEKGLELIVTTEGPVPRRIFSDPTRLRQILMNLVGNSLKYTEAGMVELRVRSVSSPQTHSSMVLEFEVKDTGQGIPAENVSKLFLPFTQGDSSASRRFGGTGLGLYLSKRLAQALGGDLILRETSENRGSIFVFTIDAGPFETDVKFYTERSTLGMNAGHEQSLHGLKVLVVDDSPDNRLLVRRILEHSNAEVETADNGLIAVELVKEKKGEFDLILMDIQMPIMDGYESFKQIREYGFGKPIVALTAHALHSEREQCFALGFDDHLSKPIDRKVLVETISRLTQDLRVHHKPNLVSLRPMH